MLHAPKLHYQIAPTIWAGSYIGNGIASQVEPQLRWLQSQGVTLIIDLTVPSDELPSYLPQLMQYAPHITWLSFAISDGDTLAPATMLAILDTLSATHHQNTNLYIHFWRDISRTDMVASCWFMCQGVTAEAA